MWFLLSTGFPISEIAKYRADFTADTDQTVTTLLVETSLMSVRCSLNCILVISFYRNYGSRFDIFIRKKQAHFKQKVTHIQSIRTAFAEAITIKNGA